MRDHEHARCPNSYVASSLFALVLPSVFALRVVSKRTNGGAAASSSLRGGVGGGAGGSSGVPDFTADRSRAEDQGLPRRHSTGRDEPAPRPPRLLPGESQRGALA